MRQNRRYLTGALAFLSVAAQSRAASLVIVPTFDSTITSLSNASTVEASIKSVIAAYEADFTNPITVNITFKKQTSGVGNSTYNNYVIPYSTYINALNASKTSPSDKTAMAHLAIGSKNPINSGVSMLIRSSVAKALGLGSLLNLTPAASDGAVSLNVAEMNVTRTGTQNAKYYDLETVAMHEIDEVLGLGSTLGQGLAAPYTTYPSPEDLFRYDSTGKRSFTTASTATAWFSLDGTTHLGQFNNTGVGDYGDWLNATTIQVQDANATAGKEANLNVELRALDVIGYTLVTSLQK